MSLFNLTESAIKQMSNLIDENKVDAVRLEVQGGGCAGFKYNWGFTSITNIADNDEVVDLPNGKFVVDSSSSLFVAGTTIDYVKEVWGSSFQIKNPNATSSCGCGESFGV
jgi:iron-sulfur cluster insertion protein